jgi:uncharacterized protein (TIGR02996 family)
MMELRALLEGISRHPADDLRRWILADWLDDHNHPNGEILRTALNYRGWEHEAHFPHPFRAWLSTVIPSLLKTVEPLRSRGIGFAINCGFVDEVELSSFQLARCGRWLTELYPMRSIRLRWDPSEQNELLQIKKFENLSQLTELVLDPLWPTNSIPPSSCARLLDTPLLENLQQLVIFFYHSHRTDLHHRSEFMTWLLNSPPWRLKRLRLIGNCVEKYDFLQKLNESRLANQLEMLDLDYLPLDSTGEAINLLAELPETIRVVGLRPNLANALLEKPGSEFELMDRLLRLRVEMAKRGRELYLNNHWLELPLGSWREEFDPLHSHFPGSSTFEHEAYFHDGSDFAELVQITDEEEATQYGRVFPTGKPETPTRREENRGRFRNPRRRE